MSLALTEGDPRDLLREAFRRVPDAPGKARGESRVTLGGISWEQWFWRRGALEIWTLHADSYDGPANTSRLLPALDVVLLTRCLALPSWRDACKTFRGALEA